MKKIFLLDDNSRNQRQAFGVDFVDANRFANCFVHIEQLNDKSDFTFIHNAACILVHDSLEDYIDSAFCHGSHKAKKIVEDLIYDNDIPYTFFSDGHDGVSMLKEYPYCINELTKVDFYLNLESFVKFYADNGEIDFRILAYGNNYKLRQFEVWVDKLFEPLRKANKEDVISVSQIKLDVFRNIIEAAQPKIVGNVNDILNSIEDNDSTIGEFKNNINRILKSMVLYGKNIYTWQ